MLARGGGHGKDFDYLFEKENLRYVLYLRILGTFKVPK